MRKSILAIAAISSLLSSALVSAGENYNYSHITVGVGFGNSEIEGLKIDDTTGFIRGDYELSSLPLILRAGYAYTNVNDDELPSDVDIDKTTYFVGAKLVFSPTDRLDILPGISIGRGDTTVRVGSSETESEITAYTTSLDVRFHLERGLWLTTGVAYQDYDEKLLDSTNFFNIGAEYVVNDDWALGLDYITHSDGNSTRLFAKIFY